MSFRRRISLLTGGAVALAIVLASLGAYAAISDQLHGQVDDSLRDRARQFVQIRARAIAISRPFPGGVPGDRVLLAAPPRIRGGSDFFEQIVAPDGTIAGPGRADRVFVVGEGVREVAAGEADGYLTDTRIDGQRVRMVVAPLPEGGAIVLGRSLDETATILSRVRLILVLVAIGGVALAALLGRLIADRAIAPLRRLTSTAEHVTRTGDFTRRIETGADEDEIGRLATRFNEMLDTVQSAMASRDASLHAQRQLVADASHELRTPVTSLRTNIEVLQANPDLDPVRRDELLTRATAQAEELTALVNDVIELGRGDEAEPSVQRIRFDELVEEAIERARRHAPAQAFDVELDEVLLEGSPDRIARAVNNLLDNAVRFNAGGRPIEVLLTGDGVLTVRDHGPGFAEDELEHVFDRFFRGSRSRERSGSGLGLSIVRQVAHAHGGEAGARNAPGGGALMTLRLPVGVLPPMEPLPLP